MTTLEIILAMCHLTLLAPLCVLGLHKAWMILLWARRRQPEARAGAPIASGAPLDPGVPRVTVQLPVFNERYVVERLLTAVAGLDYPRHRLEIQILDDSTDETTARIAALLPSLPGDLIVRHIRRPDRAGFKAGALAHGLERATGELIAVFDADFTPPPGFLRATVPHFADPEIGLVQARWGHTNRRTSLLTQTQALLLDGHFAIEQPARAQHDCFFNFNGTAGIFRRSCIDDAGGWQHDTLTEDMDLSYRAQLAGWKFRYLKTLDCPAELPIDMNGFLTQQHRWAKGSVQTGRKLIGKIFRAPLPWLTKVESLFHLFGNFAFPILLGVILVAMPLQLVRWLLEAPIPASLAFAEGIPLLAATASVFAYYGLSQISLRQFGPLTALKLPMVLVLGAGTCLNNTLAVLSAFRRDPGEFRRTPKGDAAGATPDATYHSPRGWLPLAELLLAGWAATTTGLAIRLGLWGPAAFHGLFAVGLFWVGWSSWRANRRLRTLLPLALLASCSGSGGGSSPIRVTDAPAELISCRARIEDEFARTEVVYATRQGLGADDLPSRSGMEFGVRFHPDGKRVIFARERLKNRETSREIHLASIDNSVFDTRLTANNDIDDCPCWAVDGTAIVFSSARAGSRHLWRMDADGGNPTQLTRGNVEDRDPDWNAPTSALVFSRLDTQASSARAQLFLTDATGSNLIRLTDGGTGAGDFEPAFAPDGQSVLFVRQLAADRQVLMTVSLAQPVPTPVGDGGGEDRYPRWSPAGDRIFAVRARPAAGIFGRRLFSMRPDGGDPVMIFVDQNTTDLGFDLVPGLGPMPALAPDDTDADVPGGELTMRLGVVSGGNRRLLDRRDGNTLAVRAQEFENRLVAGVLLTQDLPVTDPEDVAWVTVHVTAALSRTDADSFLRLALRDFVGRRYDTAVELSPTGTALQTLTFQFASLRHVDSNGRIQLEVIGDATDGDPVDLHIDHIEVLVRRKAAN